MKKVLAIALIIGLVGCYAPAKTTAPVAPCPPPPAPVVVKPAPVVPAPVPPPPAPVVQKKIEILPFYFDFDKSNLKDQKATIEYAVRALNADKTRTAEIQGNCDKKGSDKYNMKLGEKRAITVKDILVKSGIDGKRLTTKSFGKTKATGNDAKDRRVDIVLK